METNQELRAEIEREMADSLNLLAHTDWVEEYGNGEDPGYDEPDPGAVKAARELRDALETQHGKSLDYLYHKVCEMASEDGLSEMHRTPEYFGHYTVMSHLGHGVGIWDYFGDRAEKFLNVPYGEFSYFHLENEEKYPLPEPEPLSPEQQARNREICAVLDLIPQRPGSLFAPGKDA